MSFDDINQTLLKIAEDLREESSPEEDSIRTAVDNLEEFMPRFEQKLEKINRELRRGLDRIKSHVDKVKQALSQEDHGSVSDYLKIMLDESDELVMSRFGKNELDRLMGEDSELVELANDFIESFKESENA